MSSLSLSQNVYILDRIRQNVIEIKATCSKSAMQLYFYYYCKLQWHRITDGGDFYELKLNFLNQDF